MAAIEFSFERYLRSKVSVDARSFNQGVWDRFVEQINQSKHTHLQVLEVGGGIGTMAIKFVDQFKTKGGRYLIIEQDPLLAEVASANLLAWADEFQSDSEGQLADSAKFQARKNDWTIQFIHMDIERWLDNQAEETFLNVIIGHAILDLLDSPKFLKAVSPFLTPDATLYFPINYDGLSIFEPQIQASLDKEIWRYYNQSMDERLIDGKISGDSQTGRHLFRDLEDADLKVLAAGSSDWLVFPTDNTYIEDESYFLLHIIKTIEDELGDHSLLDKKKFRNWIALRKEQVMSGKLIYIAHQIDVLAGLPPIKSVQAKR